MRREPIIYLISRRPSQKTKAIEGALYERYSEGYRIVTSAPETDPAEALQAWQEQGEQLALFVLVQQTGDTDPIATLEALSAIYPNAHRVILTESPSVSTDKPDYHIVNPYLPLTTRLYPTLDELLAEWRASVNQPFIYARDVMTVRTVRVRIGDSLHRAAEVIALSGVGDLMVIDNDNEFVGVLSVGDVLRAAMPDTEEITGEGGTLEQAYRLFLRKGSELMYKPIAPLVITSPLIVDPDDHVAKVAALMLEKNIHRLPVVKDGRLLGTVGRTDICLAVVGML
jgi:CBS domain-containing protein